MRLISSGAWTVYARSASSSSSPTVRSLVVSRLPPRMTPRFWGQTSTKSAPALFERFEILGEPDDAVRIQPGQVGTHAPKDHTVPFLP